MSALSFDRKFYKTHLEKVSRSFAFCIEELKDDLQAEVALAYLLFRVLDTIEDSSWESKAQQKKCFDLFLAQLANPQDASELKKLLLSAKSKKEEAELARDSQILFDAYSKLNAERKAPLQRSLKIMTEGMEHFALEKSHLIQNLSELDSYCYYVAGCIGELLTAWVFKNPSEEVLKESVDFGLFLQKINILKDFQDDESEGRNFLWSWEEVAQSLPAHALAAFNYLQKIPHERDDYKIFCAWSFFLGLMSYPYIEKSLQTKKREKIPRLEAWQLLKQIKKDITKKSDLMDHYSKLSATLLHTKLT